MPNVDVVVYLAIGMTGRNKKQMWAETLAAKAELEARGITVISPVMAEGVDKTDELLIPISHEELHGQWVNDKLLIRKSHVLFDITGPLKSEGVAHEIGYARFGLFMPVVRLYPNLGPSIAREENDGIVSSVAEGADLIVRKWGTRWDRIKWRIMERKFLWKWPRLIFFQAKGLGR